MKYKVGDTVQIRSDLNDTAVYGIYKATASMASMAGKTAKIEKVFHQGHPNAFYVINGLNWWTDQMIEKKVEENEMTKDDLKVGYVLVMRSGKVKMIVPTQKGMVAASPTTPYDPIDDYADNLKPKWTTNNLYDVMRVYGFAEYPSDALEVSILNRPLLWKRKEEPIEITTAEAIKILAEKKGVSADRIRIKE